MSKPVQMNSETTKVNVVVSSAMARMLRRAFSLSSLIEQNEQHTNQRQEGDQRKDGPVGHQSIIQVTSAATPISMAKA